MWRNYLTTGIRALLKSKTYAFINIFGLALALAPCLILLLFVRYETSYDSWIPGAERVFQLQRFSASDPAEWATQSSSIPARMALAKDFPQIERSVHLIYWTPSVIQNGEASIPKTFVIADGNLFDVIQLPFLKGDPKHALDRPGSLVLTEEEARRRFPHQDALGKTLTLILDSEPADYRVTGVIRDLPRNTHLRLGMVLRADLHALPGLPDGFFTNFTVEGGPSYYKLRPGADAQAINAQLAAWEKRHLPATDRFTRELSKSTDWKLVNIRDIHLGGAMGYMAPGTDRRTVVTFGMIALLILGMAVVNFVNLATARGSGRAREVALRKVAGASRRQLIVQFLAESTLLTAFAMLLGLALAELLLPYVNAYLDIDMKIRYFGGGGVLLPILVLILLVGIAGGIYPAFYLSRFQPARILKANKSAAEAEGSGRLRSFLVVGQFAVSIGLIVCAAVIYAQTLYARTADPGYKRDGLLQAGNLDPSITQSQRETLKREVGKIAGVREAALTAMGVNAGCCGIGLRMPGRSEPLILEQYDVDAKFFDAMGMTLLAGRKFDETIVKDHVPPDPHPGREPTREEVQAWLAKGVNVIVSELAARAFGFASPQAAIGKTVENEGPPFTIVGVVKDVRFRSARQSLQPTLYYLGGGRFFGGGRFNMLMVRYDAPDPGRISRDVAKTWRRVIPTLPVTVEYADDRVRDMYRPDEARGRLFGAFALVAIVIGCLGLFGLAAFTAERRTKEIGIRKVLGARTQDIVRLLAWQFSRPVLLANPIAWPVAWWLMRDWLNGFDARIPLSPAFFLLAGALALIIAIGTIAGHAIKVARAKPIRALRYE